MKQIREYLEIGSKETGVPEGEETFYDSLKKDVKEYLDRSWLIIADLVLADYSMKIRSDMELRSPIERLMYLGLWRVFLRDFIVWPDSCILKIDITLKEISEFLQDKRGYHRVYFADDINYQLDFFLWLDNRFVSIGENRLIRYPVTCIIECDGHDFHEKTKEQAKKDKSKDRTLEERGLHVIRFTGSEITKDPERCALQVKDYVESKRDEIVRIFQETQIIKEGI